jgi:AraC family cel operon transcriptional repressor
MKKRLDVKGKKDATMRAELVDPRIGVHVGAYSVFPPYAKMHDHEYGEIFIIASGRMIQLQGLALKQDLVTEGTVVFLAPQHIHGFRRYKRDDCCMINLAISLDTLRAVERFYGKEIFRRLYWRAPTPAKIQLGVLEKEDLIRRLPDDHVPPERRRFILAGIVAELFGRLMGWSEGRDTHALPTWLSRACSIMRQKENFTRGISALHAAAHKAPEHVCRSFQKHLGTTPTEFINSLRIEHAANLLLQTDIKTSAAASECGYRSASYFFKQFKKRKGVSPSGYRKSAAHSHAPV